MSSDSSLTFHARSEEETNRLGSRLAPLLQPNDVLALNGNLGAGKTHFVKAIAAGLGADSESVNSPTFVLIQEYPGRLTVYHFDTYRLHDADEFLELGADEILTAGGVCLIEWADRVADVLPPDRLCISIEHTGPTSRLFRLNANGVRSEELLSALQNHIDKNFPQ